MHLRLNRDIVNETKITKPIDVVELGISRKTDDFLLPLIRIYFSDNFEELESLDFKNAENKAIRCVEFKPRGKFTYAQIRQTVNSNFKYCRVALEKEMPINGFVDLYYDLVK